MAPSPGLLLPHTVAVAMSKQASSAQPADQPDAKRSKPTTSEDKDTMADSRPSLRLGSVAPDFEAKTTQGPIKFHEWLGGSWAILFSHPADKTPVCTTELGEVAKLEKEWKKRNVKTLGLSCNDLDSHEDWIKDINELSSVDLSFPIIADPERKIAYLYDMLDHQDITNLDDKGIPFTVRSVFVIDPSKKIRLTLQYPASTGRQFNEVLRCIDSLQLGDRRKITTPANWLPGQKVIIHPSVSTEKAIEEYGKENVEIAKPYLRFTTLKD